MVNINSVIGQHIVSPCLIKAKELSALVQNHVSCKWGPKSFSIFNDVDFILEASNFGDLAAFRVIFSVFSLHVQRNVYL